jgi:hypothetical protein
MLQLFTRKGDNKPEWPERADLPWLTDKEASAALCLLRLLVQAGAADVYTQPLPDPASLHNGAPLLASCPGASIGFLPAKPVTFRAFARMCPRTIGAATPQTPPTPPDA